MPEAQWGVHTIKSHGTQLARKHLHDWLILLLLMAIIGVLNMIEPFHRYVGPHMLDDIKFPFYKHDTIPFWAVPIYTVLLPVAVFFLFYCLRRDVYDLHYATLGLFYALLITGVITDAIKDGVGRPRPNFFFRCFADGVPVFNVTGDGNVICTNPNKKVIKEGYKSFPSGHTSWSFAGLGFLAWYLCGKLKTYDGRGHASKMCLVLLPYLCAALVAVSRVDDYWHHWTDVFAGALIGTTVSALCYLQFFPFPHTTDGRNVFILQPTWGLLYLLTTAAFGFPSAPLPGNTGSAMDDSYDDDNDGDVDSANHVYNDDYFLR